MKGQNIYFVSFIVSLLLIFSAAASADEGEENLKRCLDGNYPSLCKHNLLSAEELTRAKEAERQVNLKRCLDGNYPSLCKYNLLSASEQKKAREAETKEATAATQKKSTKSGVTRSKNGACYEASIVKPSPFMGNSGEIFKLNDDSLWEVKYEYAYLYEYYPEVIICPSKGKLVIKGKSLNVEHVGDL